MTLAMVDNTTRGGGRRRTYHTYQDEEEGKEGTFSSEDERDEVVCRS